MRLGGSPAVRIGFSAVKPLDMRPFDDISLNGRMISEHQSIRRRDTDLRAGDTDRERIAERLRKGHAEGRLDTAEFTERIERCYDAKTFGELRQLVRDLPSQNDQNARRSSGSFRPWGVMPFAPFLVALIVVSMATGHHVFWFWIPLAFFFWRMSWWRRRQWWAHSRYRPHDVI